MVRQSAVRGGPWSRQRVGKTAARIKKLQRVGFEWTVEQAELCDERFVALWRFTKKHGHARVPTKFADDPVLGTWVNTQRQRTRRSRSSGQVRAVV
jgi:hypothetical protein